MTTSTVPTTPSSPIADPPPSDADPTPPDTGATSSDTDPTPPQPSPTPPDTSPHKLEAADRGGRPKRGYTITKKQYSARLKRMEGQVRGIQRMIEEDTYCIDVLQQISAVQGALQNVAIGLLNEHIEHCVANAAAGQDPENARSMITEATRAVERLVKS
jgi:CsoR family transcriptional regulator, copper-sensing transcriptional repressor